MKTALVTSCIAAICILFMGSCRRIDPGHVGIKVNQWGDDKGVDVYPTVTGMQMYNPFTTTIYEFPTFSQNHIWDLEDGDESITFNSKQGTILNADIAISFQIKPDRAPYVFSKFRKGIDEITHVFLRSEIRDIMGRVASQTDTMVIMGPGKVQFLDAVKNEANSRLGENFTFELISFVGRIRCDDSVMDAINATIAASQNAISAENKVATATAEANQAIQKARGEAESTKLSANAQAENILAVARAQAEANKILSASLTPELISYKQIEKWDGRQPQIMTGAGSIIPMIDINKQ